MEFGEAPVAEASSIHVDEQKVAQLLEFFGGQTDQRAAMAPYEELTIDSLMDGCEAWTFDGVV
jgi:hypothetical protein